MKHGGKLSLLLVLLLLLPSWGDHTRSGDSDCIYSPQSTNTQNRAIEALESVEITEALRDGDSLVHLRLIPAESVTARYDEEGDDENNTGPPMMNRFYMYAFRYATNANLIAVQLPETWYYQSEAHRQIMRHNGPQMESLLRSALGRAAGEVLLNDTFDSDTLAWAQAPAVTAEGFRQRFQPGMTFNVRGSIRGAGAGFRYNVAGVSISSAYTSQNGGLEALRISKPFSGDWERGEVGVDTNGAVWLNYVGRW